jgi:hypothetical protein
VVWETTPLRLAFRARESGGGVPSRVSSKGGGVVPSHISSEGGVVWLGNSPSVSRFERGRVVVVVVVCHLTFRVREGVVRLGNDPPPSHISSEGGWWLEINLEKPIKKELE